jgi:acyl-CoA synthetase (NDP forming)
MSGDHAAVPTGSTVVPEPEVKAQLAARGVAVPAGVTFASGAPVPAEVSQLRAPLVVKAFGPSIVHKSDIGAVQLGVSHAEVASVVAAMGARVDAAGFLVEEQCEPGVELIAGVVDRGYGPMVAVGFGGTLTEVLDDVVLRCAPVGHDDALAMLDELRGAAILRGTRGRPAVDRDAVARVVVAVGDLAAELGATCAELECNPVIARPDGAVAVDARLIRRDDVAAASAGDVAAAATDFSAMFAPRGVAIAGASATKSTFGNRFLAAYRDYGWTDSLFALHPTAEQIDGVPAYPSLADIPAPVDYVLAAVPATGCADLVRSATGVTPFVHVISGGFGEVGETGRALEAGLRAAARESGVRVLGPNCMGAFAPAGRLTFQEDAPRTAGHVGVISQSGGLAGDIVKVGDLRGVRFSKLVTMGNAVDVTPGELADWLVDDPDTEVLGLYVEDPRDGASLVRALRRAKGRTPVVAMVGGLSRQGGEAVASHTGSLAGDERVWQAIAASTGITVVRTLEDLIGSLVMLQRHARTPSNGERNVLVIGVGGGASVLATDACDRAGLTVTKVDTAIQTDLRAMGYGAGTSVANPLEIPFGPVAPLDAFTRVLDPILARQPYGDLIVHFNVQSYFSFGPGGADKLLPSLDMVADLAYPGTRVTLVPRNVDTAPPELAAAMFARAVERGLPCYRTLDEAAVAVAAVQQFTAARG